MEYPLSHSNALINFLTADNYYFVFVFVSAQKYFTVNYIANYFAIN